MTEHQREREESGRKGGDNEREGQNGKRKKRQTEKEKDSLWISGLIASVAAVRMRCHTHSSLPQDHNTK